MKKLTLGILVAFFATLGMQSFSQGCMEASDDGARIIGFMQPSYEFNFNGVDAEGNSIDTENTFNFKRARLGVTGSIPYDFSYYAVIEFSPTRGPGLLDVFVSYHGLGHWVNFTMGQYKPFFTLELSTPCHKLHTIERSLVVNELASPFRDMGFMVWGGSGDKSIFGGDHPNQIQYWVSIMNGTGRNVNDNNNAKDYLARVVISPWRWLRLGGNFKTGKQKPARPELDEDTRTRYGGEMELIFGNFLLQSEYIYGDDKGSTLVGGGCGQEPTLVLGDFQKHGFYAQAMYMFWNKFQPVLKYEYYSPDMNKENNLVTTWTLGVNFFPNDWTRVQANYLINDNQSAVQYYQSQFQLQVQAVIP
jgi:phosphate-selective porin